MDDEKLLKAYRRVGKIKGFYIYLIIYFVVNIIFFIVNLIATPGDWWFFYPLAILSFVLLWVAMDAFVFSRLKSNSWEKRRLKEVMKHMEEDNLKTSLERTMLFYSVLVHHFLCGPI